MAAIGLKSYILDNNFKSGLLLAGFPILLIGVAYGLQLVLMGMGALPTTGDLGGDLALSLRMLVASAPLALIVAAVWYAIAYWSHGAIISLATGAKGVTRAQEPDLYNLLENLCISRGLTTPSLKIIETDALNAYASGLNEKQYSVTVTRGLMQSLSREELECVLGHELTHIINRDTRLMVICAVFAGIISLIAEMMARSMRYAGAWSGGGRKRSGKGGGGVLILIGLALIFIGYALAIVLRFALSRKREFLADAGAVELTKNPDAMIRALQKISGHADIPAPGEVEVLFFESRATGLAGLFETHPRIEKRIEALVKYAGGRVEMVVEVPSDAAPIAEAGEPAPWGAPEPESRTEDHKRGPWG
jgi:heat shock protein HtpX